MSFKAKAKANEGDFEIPVGGTYPAVFIGLIDFGHQPREFKGKKWEEHKIYFLWELVTEQDSNGGNFVVAQDYTFSLHEKANLRKMIEGYGGKPLTDDQELDILVFVGKPCNISLTEGTSSNGKKFVEVTGVARPMKGQTVPPASRKPYIFDFEFHPDFKVDPPIPDWVPPTYGRAILDEIKRSPEWKQGAGINIPASGNGHPVTNGSGAKVMTQAEVDDDVPY